MKIKVLLAQIICAALFVAAVSAQQKYKNQVLATTTLAGVIAANVAGDTLDIVTLCPGSMCPGHYDISVNDALNYNKAGLIIQHGWERFLNRMPKTRTLMLGMENGMVPEVHMRWVNQIERSLSKAYPDYVVEFSSNAKQYSRLVQGAVSVLDSYVPKFTGMKVICEGKVRPFVQYAGFDVVDTFDGSNDMNIKNSTDLIKKSRNEHVKLVIDNVQSGSKMGELIAKELPGSTLVKINNFPVDAEKDSYIKTLIDNFEKLGKGLK